jgi:hypothetical protein
LFDVFNGTFASIMYAFVLYAQDASTVASADILVEAAKRQFAQIAR